MFSKGKTKKYDNQAFVNRLQNIKTKQLPQYENLVKYRDYPRKSRFVT